MADMSAAMTRPRDRSEQNRSIADVVRREQARLRNFIRRRVGDDDDAEDLLQDVFAELVEAYRLLDPIEEISAWLFRVARNRIIDRFRRRRFHDVRLDTLEERTGAVMDLLPSADAGPEAAYARGILLDELAEALVELPAEQRDVFIAHELDGRTFKDLAAESGLSINTLLSRKRYAVLHLRRRLKDIYHEFLDE